MMIAKVDKNTCIGCGLCSSLSPNVFQLDDDGLAGVHTSPVPDNDKGSVLEACDNCPVSAISVEDYSTTE